MAGAVRAYVPRASKRTTMTSHFVCAAVAGCLSAITALRYTAKISDGVRLRERASPAAVFNIHVSSAVILISFALAHRLTYGKRRNLRPIERPTTYTPKGYKHGCKINRTV